jgi:plasmid stability protein
MATITIRNLSPKLLRSLKLLAQRHHRSMEQEVRDILEQRVGDRLSVVEQIKQSWKAQERATTADEIEEWINTGRP